MNDPFFCKWLCTCIDQVTTPAVPGCIFSTFSCTRLALRKAPLIICLCHPTPHISTNTLLLTLPLPAHVQKSPQSLVRPASLPRARPDPHNMQGPSSQTQHPASRPTPAFNAATVALACLKPSLLPLSSSCTCSDPCAVHPPVR